jgi:hypothetical protein
MGKLTDMPPNHIDEYPPELHEVPVVQRTLPAKTIRRRERSVKRIRAALRVVNLMLEQYEINGEDNRAEYSYALAGKHMLDMALHELRHFQKG